MQRQSTMEALESEETTPPEAEPPADQAWHAWETEQVIEALGSDAGDGLDEGTASQRLAEMGPNTLRNQGETRWYQVLVRQFADVLILILVIAAGVSLLAGEVVDAIAILAIVAINGALGFVQEWKAENALKALRQMLVPNCQVLRDGRARKVEASGLVYGDIALLEAGDRVPADVRILQANRLQLDESALTGESVSVGKQPAAVSADTALAERASMAWMGTVVTGGRGRGVVVHTGEKTEFGRIAGLTESIADAATPLQKKLGKLGRQLGLAAMVVAVVIGLAGWASGKPLLEMFMTGVSLAVAVVPEGLPAVVTLTIALGIRAMVRKKALLRRLRAAEGLGAATVVCTDKTGTLTQNQMTVKKIWLPAGDVDVTGVGYDPAGHFEQRGQRLDYQSRSDLLALLEAGMHCSHATLTRDESGWHAAGEPTESALVAAAFKAWLATPEPSHIVHENPFSSERKRMSVVERAEDGLRIYAKGAPEVMLPRCTHVQDGTDTRPLQEQDLQAAEQAYTQMAERGLRTLAIARRNRVDEPNWEADDVENDLTLLGIVGMLDPPRPEVPDAVRLAKTAGIRVFMITGDSSVTALAIAGQIGLPATQAISGGELERMDDAQLWQTLQSDVVFARTAPEHKLRIVRVLQAHGHVVGMTGDGVNDAPALKQADIGIAMGMRGTDVAKGAADIILTDDNFSSIIGAIEEGRRQYDNIQKFVRYLLSSNTGEVVAILLSILTGAPLILLPVQILWMNLLTDGPTALAIGLDPAENTVMKRPPRDPRAGILNWAGVAMVAGLGTYIGLATYVLFQIYWQSGNPQDVLVAQTMAFTGIILIEKMNVFNFRSLAGPLTWSAARSNPWVLIAILAAVGMQLCAVYVPFFQGVLRTAPLRLADWGLLLVAAVPIVFLAEMTKRLHAWRSDAH